VYHPCCITCSPPFRTLSLLYCIARPPSCITRVASPAHCHLAPRPLLYCIMLHYPRPAHHHASPILPCCITCSPPFSTLSLTVLHNPSYHVASPACCHASPVLPCCITCSPPLASCPYCNALPTCHHASPVLPCCITRSLPFSTPSLRYCITRPTMLHHPLTAI
jgi:hypothetical protein